ncbi:hypothetical protein Celaphus_00010033 [Cervus elaphus hippelaphus]|uniref:Uncharacterized protein n=1 Tax=Cervus elaphus hippelaphus TaxID=46360 RepID=A0A212BZB5_CEREH|nr:hypothetical protein Celaphus_00010033 [Cervus elaphus hippelaphus]
MPCILQRQCSQGLQPLGSPRGFLNSDICYGRSSKTAAGLKEDVYITEITCDVIIQATVCKKVYNTELTLPQKGIVTLFCYWNSCVAGTMLCCIHTLPLRQTKPHRQFNETVAPGSTRRMTMFKEKLCVVYPSGFSLLTIPEDEQYLSLFQLSDSHGAWVRNASPCGSHAKYFASLTGGKARSCSSQSFSVGSLQKKGVQFKALIEWIRDKEPASTRRCGAIVL